jgi:acetyltransferase
VLVGLGGVAVEVWHDVSMRLAPVTEAIAAAMLDELRGVALLGAFRGRPPADRDALVQAIVNLSELAAAHPEIIECDINPLLVFERSQGCVAVDVRMRVDA